MTRVLIALISVSVLTACSTDNLGEGKFRNYLVRLSTASGIEAPIKAPIKTPLTLPRSQFAIAPTAPKGNDKLSLLDFLSLSGCELQANIARRNTTMGKTASSSQKLILDLEFLRLAPACVRKLKTDNENEIALAIETSSQQRAGELKHTLYDAILGGTEWQQFWQTPEALADYPQSTSGDAAQSLWVLSRRVERFLSGQWSAGDEALEPLLADIRVNAGGHLLLAAALQQEQLGRANQLLATAYKKGRYCHRARATDAGTITKTVVAKFFAGDVQSWSAAVSQRYYEIQSPMQSLEASLSEVLPSDYVVWAAARDKLLESLYIAPRQHVLAIKNTVENC